MDDNKVDQFRRWSLAASESIDAWRIVPRAFLVGYGMMVFHLTDWFLKQTTLVKKECDAAVLQTLLENNVDLVKAQEVACQIVDVVGGPTTAQTSFVGAICGLATVVFGFYTNSGRDWHKSILPWKFGQAKATKEEKDEVQQLNG